jgi:hypothetical protein
MEVRQLEGRGRVALGPSPCPYSPECVEGKFCELLNDGVLRSSPPEVLPLYLAKAFRLEINDHLGYVLCLPLPRYLWCCSERGRGLITCLSSSYSRGVLGMRKIVLPLAWVALVVLLSLGVSGCKSRACYELAQKRLTNAENWGPTKNRTNGDIRISMRFFSRVHNTL